jgi:DUF1365 family protein
MVAALDGNSYLMVGSVRHRRLAPIEHTLSSSLFMPCIDLDELTQLSNNIWGFGERWWHWARFKRSDYLGTGDLKQAVVEKIVELGGEKLSNSKVMALVHLRYVGVYFSPVNFYYIYDDQGEWRYLLAEVSNTPWNETHCYLVPVENGLVDGYRHDKAFHVSPFNPISQRYLWRAKPLTRHLMVHLECHKPDKVFDATLSMKATPLNSRNLVKALVKTPIMAVKVIWGIYWHALVLWRKGAPVYDHPKIKNK